MATERLRTIKPSSGDYTSLSAAEAGEDDTGDLVGRNEWLHLSCYYISGGDTTSVEINGFTTDATRYILIDTPSSERHDGKWNTNKYFLWATSLVTAGVINIYDDFVFVDGLQIGKSGSSAGGQNVYNVGANTSGSNQSRLSNSLIRGYGGTTYEEIGVYTGSSNNNLVLWNNIIYNIAKKAASGAEAIRVSNCNTLKIYSCTVFGGYRGLRCDAGTVTAKNTYIGDTSSEDWYFAGGTLAKTNCASEDASADDAGGNESQTNCIISIAINTSNFTNVTATTEDYHLPSASSGLVGVGVDTTGDSAPLNFTTNIDGDTRDATWDIGADSWVVAASGLSIPLIANGFMEGGFTAMNGGIN